MKTEKQELERYREDTEYYERNRESLVRDHPNEWVAILNQKVVGASADLDELLDDLEHKQIPLGEALIEYLGAEEELLILGEE